MWPPPLFDDMPPWRRAAGALGGPIVFGALCGWMLGVSEAAYVVLTTLGILGGLSAGFEHPGPRAGAVRGALGGFLFASTILVVNALLGQDPKANLPDPHALLIVIFTVIATLLGALGGWWRSRRPGVRSA